MRRDGWHWIAKQWRLDIYEKAMLWAIKSCQFRDRPRILDHDTIAQLASMSKRQVIRCEQRLETFGYLKVKRLGSRKPNSYQVVRLQGDLFDRGYMEHPVQYAGSLATARIPLVSASHNEPSKPPPLVPGSHPIFVGSTSSEEAKTAHKTARPIPTLNEMGTEEHERRQAVKNQRMVMERLGIQRDRKEAAMLRRKRENQRIDDRIAELRRQAQQIIGANV